MLEIFHKERKGHFPYVIDTLLDGGSHPQTSIILVLLKRFENWQFINIGSWNGLEPTGDRPFSEQMMTPMHVWATNPEYFN